MHDSNTRNGSYPRKRAVGRAKACTAEGEARSRVNATERDVLELNMTCFIFLNISAKDNARDASCLVSNNFWSSSYESSGPMSYEKRFDTKGYLRSLDFAFPTCVLLGRVWCARGPPAGEAQCTALSGLLRLTLLHFALSQTCS